MTSELNHFEWPGPDIRGDSTEAISFGFLPRKVRTRLREMIRARIMEKNITTIDRDFDAKKALDELQQRQKSTKDRNRKRKIHHTQCTRTFDPWVSADVRKNPIVCGTCLGPRTRPKIISLQ